MQIKKYEVLINEETASCGLLVSPNSYDLSFFNNAYLQYNIDRENKTINVFSKDNAISFYNIDEQLMYYAYKTETLIIFVGIMDEIRHFSNVYEACMSD